MTSQGRGFQGSLRTFNCFNHAANATPRIRRSSRHLFSGAVEACASRCTYEPSRSPVTVVYLFLSLQCIKEPELHREPPNFASKCSSGMYQLVERVRDSFPGHIFRPANSIARDVHAASFMYSDDCGRLLLHSVRHSRLLWASLIATQYAQSVPASKARGAFFVLGVFSLHTGPNFAACSSKKPMHLFTCR